MAIVNWIASTGSQSWTNTANWSTGAVPVTGDDVYVNFGNADINSGLANIAVNLNSLHVGPSFTGTIGVGAPFIAGLHIGVSGNVSFDTTSTSMFIELSNQVSTVVVLNTGQPISTATGAESLQIWGGATGSSIAVTGQNSSVGLATVFPQLVGTMEWSIEDGTLNVGSGITWVDGKQSSANGSSGGTVTTYGAGTLITQSGSSGNLITRGTSAITGIVATSNAGIYNRPASGTDAFATLVIGPGATVDASGNPTPFTITTSITMANQASWSTFNAAQCQIHGGGEYPIILQECSPNSVTLATGSPCTVRIAAS